MADLNCSECRIRLHPYLDNELDAGEALRVHDHLRGCPDCRLELENLEALRSGLRESLPRYALPELSERRILSGLKSRSPARWMAPAFSAAALAASLLFFFLTPTQRDSTVEEAISSHVRSLQEGHLTDVLSSDKHTVKPWFAGRLDFSPPVTDFAAQGFPLAGGRLDYLHGRNAAGLVYRRDKHVINLFITTTEKADAGPEENLVRGYAVFSWRRKHLEFTAVSDLNASELNTFVELVSSQP